MRTKKYSNPFLIALINLKMYIPILVSIGEGVVEIETSYRKPHNLAKISDEST